MARVALSPPVLQSSKQVNARRGYVALLVCGFCVAFNVMAYLPSLSFEDAEAAEFTVTLFLLIVFVVSMLAASVFVFKGRADVVLLGLFSFTVALALSTNFVGGLSAQARVTSQLAYALPVISIAGFRLIQKEHS